MPRPMKIDFVSDVACPWCAVGLNGLEEALARTGDLIDATITFQPFELNPDMPREGEDGAEHITRKYGISAEQAAANRNVIRDRAAAVGFDMGGIDGRRVYNTFDAHRLLHWAEGSGHQAALKHALLEANFTQGLDVSDPEVLVAAAERAGLDGDAAREVLASGRYTAEVRDAERLWQSRGINSVPAIVIDDRYLISGGQPPEAFEQALRRIAAEAA
ncbi:DsbA family oxidoreductase [Sphingomonas sp.]|uniref:DsbA family oxidoreductase n=1 Tax=Sphingomonas sp. TaxID=28214 RepID=UPI0025DE40C2|nr:DsbA family oxidoreductase [Sphingomonas sp.]